MSRNWTQDQLTAIEARDGTLLLSAAAGSGKTAVLIERVLRRLTDPQRPSDPDRLLVVTFTNAAAAEMKQKLLRALSALAAQNPGRRDLLRLGIKMQNANISTMDSFCIRLVRENAATLGVRPDFRICEGGELNLMLENAISETLHTLHEQENDTLEPMLGQFFKNNDDAQLAQAIEMLYDNSCSYPFPDLWLSQVAAMYSSNAPLSQTLWGHAILEGVSDTLRYCTALADEAAALLPIIEQEEPNLYAVLCEPLTLLRTNVDTCRSLLGAGDWDALAEFANTMTFAKMNKGKSSPLKTAFAARHNAVKDIMQTLPGRLCASETEHREDMALLRPVAEGLVEAVRLFRQNLDALKAEANALSFSDILHLALELLYTHENNTITKTPFAIELAAQFDEILIDEYQDTNKAQDLLFRGLSQEEANLFMVGDVKQSIYGFRLANPGIFVDNSERLPIYQDGNYPAKVILGENFRSRSGIIDSVNYIFSQIMSPQVGAVRYDENHALRCARPGAAPEGHLQTEIQFLDLDSTDGEEKAAEIEANHAAALIQNMVQSKTLLTGADGKQRPARYSDFCILLRAAAGKMTLYSNALQRCGIPVHGQNSRNFFESREILLLLSLLKAIDNPLSDVELLSLMLSPLYGFTPDEAALLRGQNRSASLYDLLTGAAAGGDANYTRLLGDLRRYRSLCASGSASDFLRALLAETKYTALLSAMSESEERKANVALLLSHAQSYDAYSSAGLPGFLRYLERLRQAENGLNAKKSPSASLQIAGGDCVQIMTIHKSKGLEFPVVILSDTMKGFNTQDSKKNLIIHQSLGVGLRIQKPEEFKKYPSIAYSAIRERTERDAKSEEMRLLYVALTRAREKLIVLATAKNYAKKVQDTAALLAFEDGAISPDCILSQNSYGNWLLCACLRHPTAGRVLRQYLDETTLPPTFVLSGAPSLTATLTPPLTLGLPTDAATIPAYEQEQQEEERSEEDRLEEERLLALITERMDYTYPYAALARISSKYAASALPGTAHTNPSASPLSKPAFLQQETANAADAGTAAHKFLQYCDFARASADLESERARLLAQNILTPLESDSLRPERLQAFFESPLCARILKAQEQNLVFREQRFAITVRAQDIDPTLPPAVADEAVFVQGVTDLVFIEDGACVIIDYKTDRVRTTAALADRYAPQLQMYKTAVERIFNKPVKETLLYSLHLGQEQKI